MKPGFTDEQIIHMIKEQGAAEQTSDARGVSEISLSAFYDCKSTCGAMEQSDVNKLCPLEIENAKLTVAAHLEKIQ